MRGRYEVEDLLKLRASPLVAKPPGLPPKEEWMGPVDSRARAPIARGKLDDTFSQSEGLQKRPAILDSSRRSTTDPERLHLGPPRHSFTSSNARTRTGTHERTKTTDETDQKIGERKSGAFGALNGRYNNDDQDTSDKPRRRYNDDEFEGRPKRDYDRPRWGNRDQLGDEEGDNRNGRDSYSRSKFDQPWIRKEKPSDGDSSPPWRRGQRDRDFDRQEADPEWADTDDVAGPAKAHTHEDFVAWMEKMKNKTASEDKQSQPEMIQKETAASIVDRQPARVVSDPNASVDKFFAKFEEKKPTNNDQNAARPTKSRFASIFGVKEEPKVDGPVHVAEIASPPPPVELEQPAPPTIANIETDKKASESAAFAKLLEMLNKNQLASTPTPPAVQSTRSPLNIAELAATRSPDLATASAPSQQNRTPVLSHTPNLSLDRIIESRSPAHHPAHEPAKSGAFSQDLLDLLRKSQPQPQQHPKPGPQQYPHYGMQPEPQRIPQPPPGLPKPPMHDSDRQNAPLINTRRDAPRSIFDDPAFAGYRREQEYQQRRSQSPPDQGGLSNLFAAMNKQNYSANQQEQRPPQSQAPPNLPPGLQRPPGLDGGPRPPPGWPGSAQPQQQHRQPPMPNYAQNPLQALYNAPGGYPPQQQQPQSQQQQQPRQMPNPLRKATEELPLNMARAAHPSQQPQPPYSNIPPGFGMSPHYASPSSPDGQMYAMRGGPGSAGAGYGLPDRERMDRERPQNVFAPMYGNANVARAGNPGSVQMPPGFR